MEWDTAVFVPENTTHPRLCRLVRPSVQEFERCEKTDGYKQGGEAGKARGEDSFQRSLSPPPAQHPSPSAGPSHGARGPAAGRDGLMASRPLPHRGNKPAPSARLQARGINAATLGERNQREGNSETAAWKTALAANSVDEMNRVGGDREVGETRSTQTVEA